MKRISKILLVLLLTITMVGCGTNNNPVATEPNADFTAFIESLPAEIEGTNGFDLNYTFHNPSAYGIEKEVGDIMPSTMEDYEESLEHCQDLLEQLKKFNYDSLDKEQQLEYDVLEDYLQRQLLLKDYIAYDNYYLGSYLGIQAQLPVILLEFQLHDKQDLETYLNVLKTSKEAFIAYVDVEKVRQEEGVGMSQVLIDGVIEQCENFAAGDVSFLVEEMNEKIDAADFLNDDEKAQAKADNEKYTKEDFVEAYNVLKEELLTVEPKEADGGIANQENSQDYYQALFQKITGLDWSISEVENFLDEQEDYYLDQLQKAMRKDSAISDKLLYPDYGEFETVEKNIDYLSHAYSDYFPDAGQMQYRVVEVPEAMQDNFSPAAYLTSRVDRAVDEPLLILVNRGSSSSTSFETISHEGYPGHMYQDCYFQQLDVSTFRYLISCSGYAEGWANYIEGKSYWFTQNDNEAELIAAADYSRLLSAMQAKWDIDINYHGMTREEFAQELQDSFGITDLDTVNGQYDILMENPTNYLMYFIGGLYLEQLYIDAEADLGSKFDPVEFHRVILDCGSVGLKVVEKYVEAYVKDNK